MIDDELRTFELILSFANCGDIHIRFKESQMLNIEVFKSILENNNGFYSVIDDFTGLENRIDTRKIVYYSVYEVQE